MNSIDILKSNLITENESITIKCPNCDHWEEQPIDQQRHHLQTFEIKKWIDEDSENNERSIMCCGECNAEFQQTWDYPNKGNGIIF